MLKMSNYLKPLKAFQSFVSIQLIFESFIFSVVDKCDKSDSYLMFWIQNNMIQHC